MKTSKSVPAPRGCPVRKAPGRRTGKLSCKLTARGHGLSMGPVWPCAGAESKLVGLKAVAAFGTPK